MSTSTTEKLVTCPGCGKHGFHAASLKKHKCRGPAQGTLAVVEKEAPSPDWSRARWMLEGIKMAVRLSLCGQICLGMELLEIKKQLGFVGSGRRENKSPTVGSLIKSWDDLVKSELGIGSTTAERLIDTAEAVKARVKKLGGAQHLIGLLETPPAKLTDEKRKILEAAVTKLTDGETQKSLLEELKLVKHAKSIEGGDTSQHVKTKVPPTGKQLAFAFFTPVAKELQTFRTHPDYQAMLHILPSDANEGELSLTSLERDLEAALHDVREAKKALSKGQAA